LSILALLLVSGHVILSQCKLTPYAAKREYDIYRALPELKDISFPSIRNWQIKGENKLFASLDFRNASTLDFESENSPIDRLLAPIPSQLTTLKLDKIIFTPESLPGGRRHSLPFLTNLTLVDIVFLGPMRKYFHCPKLKYLRYSISLSHSARDTIVENSRNPFWASIQDTLDHAFFQEASRLEFLSLESIKMDNVTASILASCPVLHTLEIKESGLDEFIWPFLESLRDPRYLPSLRMLYISRSWLLHYALSCHQFVAQCSSMRPQLYVVIDGMPFETFYNNTIRCLF
jgi:hypothetical protein